MSSCRSVVTAATFITEAVGTIPAWNSDIFFSYSRTQPSHHFLHVNYTIHVRSTLVLPPYLYGMTHSTTKNWKAQWQAGWKGTCSNHVLDHCCHTQSVIRNWIWTQHSHASTTSVWRVTSHPVCPEVNVLLIFSYILLVSWVKEKRLVKINQGRKNN